MPSLLWHGQWVAILGCLIVGLSVIAAPFGFFTYRIDEKVVTAAEYFRSVGGAFSVVLGALLGAVGIGLLKRRSWSRPVLMAGFVVVYLAALIVAAIAREQVIALVPFVAVPLWAYWYLYHKRNVVAFFASLDSSPEPPLASN